MFVADVDRAEKVGEISETGKLFRKFSHCGHGVSHASVNLGPR